MCVRTRRGGKGGGRANQRERGMDGDKEAGSGYLPAVPYPLVVRPTMKTRCRRGERKKIKFPAAYFFLLREWDCSCLRPVDDPARTRCSGDASQRGREQTDENRFSRLIRKFTFPGRLSTAQSWSCWSVI